MSGVPFLDGVLKQSAEFERGLAALAHDRPVWIEGLAGSAKTAVAASCARELGRVALIVTPDEEAGERTVQDLAVFGFPMDRIGLYPGAEPSLDEVLPEAKVAASSEEPERRALARSRMAVLEGLADHRLAGGVAPIQAALRATVGPLGENRLTLRRGEAMDLEATTRRLVELGYERVAQVDVPGEFAIRGGIMDVFPSTRLAPVRVELFGDEIDSLREFDAANQRSTREVEAVTLSPASEAARPQAGTHPESESGTFTLLEHLPPGCLVVLDEPNHLRSR